MPRESSITTSLIATLAKIPGVFVRKNHGGKYGARGFPDVVVHFNPGYDFGVISFAICEEFSKKHLGTLDTWSPGEVDPGAKWRDTIEKVLKERIRDSGVTVYLEMKRPIGTKGKSTKTSPMQISTMEALRRAGALAYVCNSKADAIAILESHGLKIPGEARK